MNKRIDIAVVNYNTKIQIRRLLHYMLDSEHEDFFNLLIADNGSTDNSLEYLRLMENNYSEIQLVANENIGYARACNQLAAMGTADIIALCNSDIWITPQQVLQIIDTFDANPQISILGPKQRDENGYVTAGGIFGTLDAPKHRGWKVFDPEDKLYRDRQEAVTVSGSAYFIRRSVWDELTNCPIYQGLEVCQNNEVSLGAFLPTPHYY